MKKYLIILFGVFIAGVAYHTFAPHEQQKRTTLFVQGLFQAPALDSIRTTITPIINQIIQSELGIQEEFAFFLPKTRTPAVTLYSIKDVDYNADRIVLNRLFEKIAAQIAERAVGIRFLQECAFFGDNQDELVLGIDDSGGELMRLHEYARDLFYYASFDYDRASSERFAYVPHVGLGHIRLGRIAERIRSKANIEVVLARIRERSVAAVQEVLRDMVSDRAPDMHITGLCVFDLQTRACVKEISF